MGLLRTTTAWPFLNNSPKPLCFLKKKRCVRSAFAFSSLLCVSVMSEHVVYAFQWRRPNTPNTIGSSGPSGLAHDFSKVVCMLAGLSDHHALASPLFVWGSDMTTLRLTRAPVYMHCRHRRNPSMSSSVRTSLCSALVLVFCYAPSRSC